MSHIIALTLWLIRIEWLELDFNSNINIVDDYYYINWKWIWFAESNPDSNWSMNTMINYYGLLL